MVKASKRAFLVCLLPLLGGCLVQEPPDIKDPERTRPFIIVGGVIPSPDRFYPVPLDTVPTSNDIFQVTVPVQSEDLGEPLQAYVHVDFFLGNSKRRPIYQTGDIQPSTLDAGPREVIMDIPVEEYGCHYFTALFAHRSSFNTNPQDGRVKPEFRSDSASVTWIVNVVDQTTDPNVLVDCPVAATDTGN